jgi:hypothetical protein
MQVPQKLCQSLGMAPLFRPEVAQVSGRVGVTSGLSWPRFRLELAPVYWSTVKIAARPFCAAVR